MKNALEGHRKVGSREGGKRKISCFVASLIHLYWAKRLEKPNLDKNIRLYQLSVIAVLETTEGKFCILLAEELTLRCALRKRFQPTMSKPYVTITFSTDEGSRTLADCLELLLGNINLETPENMPYEEKQ